MRAKRCEPKDYCKKHHTHVGGPKLKLTVIRDSVFTISGSGVYLHAEIPAGLHGNVRALGYLTNRTELVRLVAALQSALIHEEWSDLAVSRRRREFRKAGRRYRKVRKKVRES